MSDARQVDWEIGAGRNRMSWWSKPVHWMVEEVMRPWDGSASWTENAHYFAFGPLRLFIRPRLRDAVRLEQISRGFTVALGASVEGEEARR